MSDARKLSLVIPAYNEGSGVLHAHQVIRKELAEISDHLLELIFVDDGSVDDTFTHLQALSKTDPSIKVIRLATNVGSHGAIRAGLEHATGDVGCFIACDLQEPPSLILTMLERLKSPYEMVWAVRAARREGFISRSIVSIFYTLARKFVSREIPPAGATMFLVSHKVLSALKQYPERNLALDGFFATLGYRTDFVPYESRARAFGKTKWTFGKKIKQFVDFFVGFSYAPIRLVSVVGIVFFLAGILWTAYVVIRTLLVNDMEAGWPMLTSIILTGFGITNIGLGTVAEYLWRTLDESRRRPRYLIETKIGFE